MITFKKFLEARGDTEAEKTQSISIQEGIKLIEANCSEWVKKFKSSGTMFYRGMPISSKAVLGDSNSGKERKSANTNNFFTLWHDNYIAWADYPARSRSFICTTSQGYSENYGDTYLVFPYDNVNAAVLPSGDLFESFDFQDINDDGIDLGYFNGMLVEVFDILGIPNPDTYEKLISALQKINVDSFVEKIQLNDDAEGYAEYLKHLLSIAEPPDGRGIFIRIFTPDKVRQFKAKTATRLSSLQDNEVYIQGKAVMLKYGDEETNDFLDSMGIEL